MINCHLLELEEEGAAKANLFRILKYARPEWLMLLFATLNAIIQGCVFPAFSLLFTQIIQTFSPDDINDPHRDKMRKDGHFWALMFLVLAGVMGITMLFQATFYGVSAERLTKRLRSKVFRNIMRMDATYFDNPKHSPGKISTRLASDVPTVKSAIDYRIGSVFNSFVSISCGIGIAFYFCWQMALLVLAIFPLLGVAQGLQMKFLAGVAGKDAKEMENSGKIALEAIENIRTVQALTLQKRLYYHFCHHLDRPHRMNRRKALLQGLSYGFASSIFYFLYAASFRFGVWLIFAQKVDNPMNVLRTLFAISFTAGSLGWASAYFPEYAKATFAAGLIFKMLEEEPHIDGMTQNGKRPEISGAVDLIKVFFRYPERPDVTILEGLDLSVKPGETLALVGPSGCGKSTVVSLLERFYDPLDGAVMMDGEDLRGINPTWLRSHMALVSQEPILFDTSIRNNIVYGLPEGSYTEDQIIEVAMKANIHNFVSQLPDGYETRVGDKLVQEALDKASEGRTCVVVAHRLATIVNASKIMVVKQGKIIEMGTHNELMQKKGAYWALTQKQTIKQNATSDQESDDEGGTAKF
ncbi:hypothetical protein WR25_09526 [Diploscapter pachys]|uniref:ABC transmembrane type-1 domain-containing protein n=1 Tax=Diploscapter pachys TaxID=2018661 RepID=A0A2A2JX69_9BILA|nr:hypothetical protein WR25_09526 [Diploscapter pachys]